MATTTPENASDLYKSQITEIAIPSPVNKTAAKSRAVINDEKIFPQESNTLLIGGTGQIAGFYDDDSVSTYGSRVKPTSGDGTEGWGRPVTEPLNVFNYMLPAQIASVLKWDSVEDVTIPCLECEAAGIAQQRPAHFPSGRYLMTSGFECVNGSQMLGEHLNIGFVGGTDPLNQTGTMIDFKPTSLKSFWKPTGLPAIGRTNFTLEGFFIQGNSTDAAGNSDTGIEVDNITKSSFKNLRVQGFRHGITCEGTINNNFDFVHPSGNWIDNILYKGAISTTDVWSTCYITNGPIGINTTGASKNIIFNNCKIESLDTYGVNLVKETQTMTFNNCYSENVPIDNVATNTLFRVGYDGSVLALTPQLIINGGDYGGNNTSNRGSWLDVDFTSGVQIKGGPHFSRFVDGIKTSANTQTNQIVSSGFTCGSITGSIVTDITKIVGLWPDGVINSSTRNNQNAAFRQVAFPNSPSTPLDDYREFTSASQSCTGAITTVSQWDVTKIGNQVTLTLPSVTGGALAQTFFAFGALLSTSYRPSADISFPCAIYDNNANQAVPGTIQILAATGQIRVYKDLAQTATYTVSTTAGLGQSSGTCVSWTI